MSGQSIAVFAVIVIVCGSMAGCINAEAKGTFAMPSLGESVSYSYSERTVTTFEVGEQMRTRLPDSHFGACTWVDVTLPDNSLGSGESRYCLDQEWNPIIRDVPGVGPQYEQYWGQPLGEVQIMLALWPAGKTIVPGEFTGSYFGGVMSILVEYENKEDQWRISYSITWYDVETDIAMTDLFVATYEAENPWPLTLLPTTSPFGRVHQRTEHEAGSNSVVQSSTVDWQAMQSRLVTLDGAIPRGGGCDEKWIDGDTIYEVAAQDLELATALENGVFTRVELYDWGGSGTIDSNQEFRKADLRVQSNEVTYVFTVEQMKNSLGLQEPTLERHENGPASGNYRRPPATISWCQMVASLEDQQASVIQLFHSEAYENPNGVGRQTLVPGIAWGHPGWMAARPGGGAGVDVSLTTGSLIGTPPAG